MIRTGKTCRKKWSCFLLMNTLTTILCVFRDPNYDSLHVVGDFPISWEAPKKKSRSIVKKSLDEALESHEITKNPVQGIPAQALKHGCKLVFFLAMAPQTLEICAVGHLKTRFLGEHLWFSWFWVLLVDTEGAEVCQWWWRQGKLPPCQARHIQGGDNGAASKKPLPCLNAQDR